MVDVVFECPLNKRNKITSGSPSLSKQNGPQEKLSRSKNSSSPCPQFKLQNGLGLVFVCQMHSQNGPSIQNILFCLTAIYKMVPQPLVRDYCRIVGFIRLNIQNSPILFGHNVICKTALQPIIAYFSLLQDAKWPLHLILQFLVAGRSPLQLQELLLVSSFFSCQSSQNLLSIAYLVIVTIVNFAFIQCRVE